MGLTTIIAYFLFLKGILLIISIMRKDDNIRHGTMNPGGRFIFSAIKINMLQLASTA